MTVAACEVNSCGVQAIGRCSSCNAAFCATHQGITQSGHPDLVAGVKFRDQCSRCLREFEESAQREKAKLEAETTLFASSDTLASIARQMAEASCPGLQPREFHWTLTEKVFFVSKTVEKSWVGASAWPVGSRDCLGRHGMYDSLELGVTEDGTVVRMEQGHMTWRGLPIGATDEDMSGKLKGAIESASVARALLRHAQKEGVEVDLDLPG